MAAINKNFVVKNGIEVGDNLIYGDKNNLKVGIGTTTPGHTLDVRGGIGATSVSVGQTITANSGVVTSLTATNSSIDVANINISNSTWSQVGSGLTFTNGIGTNLSVSGITTVASLSIGANEVISSGRQLKNIISLDATTTATIESAIANAPNTFTDLTVSGIATFNNNVGVAGILTATAVRSTWSQVGSGLTFTTGIATNFTVSGVATITTLNSTGVTAASVSSTWAQVGSGLTFTTGIGTHLNISGILTASNVRISGIATVGNIAFRSTGSSGGIVTAADNVGIITYYGDGSNLSGIGGAPGGAGANRQIIYNSNGSFAGSSNFTFDGNNVYVSGIVTATDFNSLSDINYKDNVETVNHALLKVEQLRGVKFDWKESNLSSYGVIAQELEKVLPELVHGDEPKTVNYNGIIGVLIEAIKELKAEIEELKKYK